MITKSDCLPGEQKQYDHNREIAKSRGLPTVFWQNKCIDDDGKKCQLQELQRALDSVKSFTPEDIKDLETRIMERAEELCAAQTPLVETITETYVDYEPQIYQEQFEAYVDATRMRQEPRYRTVRELVIPIQQFFTAGIFGGGIDDQRFDGFDYVPETYQMPVVRFKDKTELVPVERIRDTEVEMRLPVEHFKDMARNQILEETHVRFATTLQQLLK